MRDLARIAEPSNNVDAKSKLQQKKEADLLLRMELLTLAARGMDFNDIAVELGLRVDTVQRLLAQSVETLHGYFTHSSPRENFVRYAAFVFDRIRKLDDVVERFTDDKGTTQYSAATNAIRTQVELYDRIFDRGQKAGIIQLQGTAPEAHLKRIDLLEVLRKERGELDALIGELEFVVEERKVTVKRSGQNRTRSNVVIDARVIPESPVEGPDQGSPPVEKGVDEAVDNGQITGLEGVEAECIGQGTAGEGPDDALAAEITKEREKRSL